MKIVKKKEFQHRVRKFRKSENHFKPETDKEMNEKIKEARKKSRALTTPDLPTKRKRGELANISEFDVAAALNACDGYITRAAKILGVTTSNISQRIKRSMYLQETLLAVEEERLDNAEQKLHELVDEKYYPAIRDYIRWKGAKRGLGQENVNIDVKEKKTLELDLSKVPKDILEKLANF